MGALKSLGQYGILAFLFFKLPKALGFYWEESFKAFLERLNLWEILNDGNGAFMVIILKLSNPQLIKDSQPIIFIQCPWQIDIECHYK